MASPRGSRFRRTGNTRRLTSWASGPLGITSLTAAGSAIIPTGSQAVENGLTLVRTRGELLVYLTTATSVLDGFSQVAAGICVVTENAFGIGATAVPAPFTDVGWDGWLWYWTGTLKSVSTTLVNGLGLAVARVPIDSKAMRKFKATDVQIGVVEVAAEVGTAAARFEMVTRSLVKLP